MDAVYYPNFEPPQFWLRAFLLFFDKLRSVVPEDARAGLSEDLIRFADRVPGAFEMITPRTDDIQFEDRQVKLLRKTFEMIRERDQREELEITFDGPSVTVAGYAFLHDSKMSNNIRDALREYGLIREDFRELSDELIPGNFSLVNRAAADLIVSNVVNRLAMRHGWHTLTDSDLDFAAGVLDRVEAGNEGRQVGRLVAAILRCEVPVEIAELTPDGYAEVRKAYENVREDFLLVVNALAGVYKIFNIADEVEFRERVAGIVERFDRQVQAAKSHVALRRCHHWTAVGLGQIVSMAMQLGAPGIGAQVTGKAVAAGVEVVSERLLGSAEPDARRLLKMIGKLRRDVLDSRDIERLIYAV